MIKFEKYDNVVNSFMRKKFWWWVKIDTESYSYSSLKPNLIAWHGTLTVDKDWYNDLCEKSPFSGCESQDGVRLNLLVNNDIQDKIKFYLNIIRLNVTGENKHITIGNTLRIKPESEVNIVNESEKTKLIDFLQKKIEDYGLMDTMKITGISWPKIFMIVGADVITRDVMLKFINDFMSKLGVGFGLSEVGEEPINYGVKNEDFREIDYFGLSSVTVDVWNSDTLESEGEFRVRYDSLSDDILMEVFDTMIRVYEDGRVLI